MRKEEFPHLQRPKLHWQKHRQSLAASSHGRTFYLNATSIKPATTTYVDCFLKMSQRLQRLKIQPKSSTVTNLLLLPLVLAGFQAITAQQ